MYKRLLIGILALSAFMVLCPQTGNGYGECNEYGPMSYYDSLSHSCKCMSGYVFGESVLGEQCVNADSVCTDKYGYNARYDSLTKSCECSYGYILGKDSIGRTQCVSPDSVCKDQLGFNSRYNSLYDKCECSYGYVISGGECKSGDSVCRSKHGIYASYEDPTNSCTCDSGYTFDDDDQCVQKQNNVYFKLKELDTDTKTAIIQSDYDSRYYRISYGTGCYALSFKRYLNGKIVINLGTDFSLDTYDKIVLQDDNEVCEIKNRALVSSSETLFEEQDELSAVEFKPSPVVKTTVPTQPVVVKAVPTNDMKVASADTKKTVANVSTTSVSTTTDPVVPSAKKKGWFSKIMKFFFK